MPGLERDEGLRGVSLSPDGALLALLPDRAGILGSVIRIVAADSGATVAEIAEPETRVDRIAWSSDSRLFVYQRWSDTESNRNGAPRDVDLVLFDIGAGSGVAFPIPGFIVALRSSAG